MAMSKSDREKAIVIALNHPLRRKILERMGGDNNGGLSASMLADELSEKLGNVSYHVRCLHRAGVLKLVSEKRRRGAIESFYKPAGNAVFKRATEALELITHN